MTVCSRFILCLYCFVYYVYDNPTYEVANKLICIICIIVSNIIIIIINNFICNSTELYLHIQYYKHIHYKINALVNITKLYIERSNLQLELIRYRIDFIDMFACEATVAMQYLPPNAYMRKFRTHTTLAPFLTV